MCYSLKNIVIVYTCDIDKDQLTLYHQLIQKTR